MSNLIPAQYDDIIEKAFYIWFTTVRKDGMPEPTPVWFVRDGNSFIIYTTPGSHKLKNLEANAHVALSFTPDFDADAYFVVMGTAQVDQSIPLAFENKAYLTKYADGMKEIDQTPESLSQAYNVPIRVTTVRIRGLEWE